MKSTESQIGPCSFYKISDVYVKKADIDLSCHLTDGVTVCFKVEFPPLRLSLLRSSRFRRVFRYEIFPISDSDAFLLCRTASLRATKNWAKCNADGQRLQLT